MICAASQRLHFAIMNTTEEDNEIIAKRGRAHTSVVFKKEVVAHSRTKILAALEDGPLLVDRFMPHLGDVVNLGWLLHDDVWTTLLSYQSNDR